MTTNIDFKTNKSICPYPWFHSYSGSRYERKLCCISKEIPTCNKQETAEFWNSDVMKKVRLDMLNGKKIDVCENCYQLEDVGVSSLRQESSIQFGHELLSKTFTETNEDGSLDLLPRYYDYRTIHCNLQCISCGPVFSSQHMTLHDKRYPKDNNFGFSIDKDFEQTLTDEMIQGLINKRITDIYWAGGEPMMSPMHWSVMEKMKELSIIDSEWEEYIMGIKIHYNTNMTKTTWKGQNVYKLLSAFKHLTLQVSIDGVAETFEYTRDGAYWDEVKTNWKEAFDTGINLQIASVLSAPVLIDIDRWFDFFEPYGVYVFNHKFHSDLQDYPNNSQAMLDIRTYPKHIFDRVINHAIKRFENSKNLKNIDKSINILNALRVERERNSDFFDNPNLIKKLKIKSEERDKFHLTGKKYSTLLQQVDPEIYEWYMNL
jgi:hypothetical protein